MSQGAATSAGLLSRFSFSPIKNQSNDRLFLAGIAGKKWMLGFRTATVGQDRFISSRLADNPRIECKQSCPSVRIVFQCPNLQSGCPETDSADYNPIVGSSRNSSQYNNLQLNVDSQPIAYRLRRKGQRQPGSIRDGKPLRQPDFLGFSRFLHFVLQTKLMFFC